MRIAEIELRSYIKEVIIESLKHEDSTVIEDIVDKLNNESQALKDELASQGNSEKFNIYIYDHLNNIVYDSSSPFEYLDAGAFRNVYAMPDQEWVLKLASSLEGAKVNKQEIQMSGIDSNDDVYHGLGARNIFTKLYDYDRFNEFPWWIISQRVIPLSDVYDIELLKSIFPSFWNILNSVTNNESDIYLDRADYKKKRSGRFIEFITSMLISASIKSKKVKKPVKNDKGWAYLNKKQKPPYYSNSSYRGITKQMIYAEALNMFAGELLPIEEINFERDVERLSRGLAYVGTTDLHEGNIGIVKSKNPSPEDIVILDFDINS